MIIGKIVLASNYKVDEWKKTLNFFQSLTKFLNKLKTDFAS